ncbi:serine-rich adhesin for platelets-like [Acropora muricata]|uniref:serine-rich adhesin for platelets-like n=1 Tax=Acropora muricata TaxID=159855 RepID=UPI0034E5E874
MASRLFHSTNGSKRESATTVAKEKREQSLSPFSGCIVQGPTNKSAPSTEASGKTKELSSREAWVTFPEATNGSKREPATTVTKEKREQSLSSSSSYSVQGPTNKTAPSTQLSGKNTELSSREGWITFSEATNGLKRESATSVTKEKREQSLSPCSGCSVQGPINNSAPSTQASGKSKELPLREPWVTFPEATNGLKRESPTTVTKEKREQSLSPSSGCSVQGPTNKSAPSSQASGKSKELLSTEAGITFPEATNGSKRELLSTVTKEKREQSLSPSSRCSLQGPTNANGPCPQALDERKEFSSIWTQITIFEATSGLQRESANTSTKKKGEQSLSHSSGSSGPEPTKKKAPSSQASSKTKELSSMKSSIFVPEAINGSKRESATTVTNEKREQSVSSSSVCSVQGPTNKLTLSVQASGKSKELSSMKSSIFVPEAINGLKSESATTVTNEKREQSVSSSSGCSVQGPTNKLTLSTPASGKSKELSSMESLITFPETNGSRRESVSTVTKGKREQSLSSSSGCSVQRPTNKSAPSTQASGKSKELSSKEARITHPEATNGSKRESAITVTKEKREQSLSPSSGCSVQGPTNKSARSTQPSGKSKELPSREAGITLLEATNGSKRESASTVSKKRREQSVSSSSGCSVESPTNKLTLSSQASGKSKELSSMECLITFPEVTNGSKRESATTVTKEKREQSLFSSSGCSVQGPTIKSSPSTQASSKSKESSSIESLTPLPEVTNGSKRESLSTVTEEKRQVQGPTNKSAPSTQASGKSKELSLREAGITFPEATNGSKKELATTVTKEEPEQSLSSSSGCSVQGPTNKSAPSTQASGKSKELSLRKAEITFPEATNGSKKESATTVTKEELEQSVSPSSGCSVEGPTNKSTPSTQGSGKSKELSSRKSLITLPEVTNGSKRESATTVTKEEREQSVSLSGDCSVQGPGHIHGDNPDAPICKDFLLGNCKKGSKCHGHHCTLPFQWQYNSYGEWITFNDGDNEKFEKLYCDVNVDKTPVTQIWVSLHDEHSDFPFESCDGTFLIDDKILVTGSTTFGSVVTLRRLSTVSYVHDPDDITATQWTWYWMDENGCWRKYGFDDMGTDLQQPLEDAFLRKSPWGFSFRIADQDYKMNFSPESDMSQENVRYGTKRKVRRRPSEFVTGNDIKLKRWKKKTDKNKLTTATDMSLTVITVITRIKTRNIAIVFQGNNHERIRKMHKTRSHDKDNMVKKQIICGKFKVGALRHFSG